MFDLRNVRDVVLSLATAATVPAADEEAAHRETDGADDDKGPRLNTDRVNKN